LNAKAAKEAQRIGTDCCGEWFYCLIRMDFNEESWKDWILFEAWRVGIEILQSGIEAEETDKVEIFKYPLKGVDEMPF
jgi:hypothetical protein